jgi:rfaE bifunctional protein nucleotidyltransferase chain/domain
MPSPDSAHGVLTRDAVKREIERLHAAGKKVVFTNGSFDLVHTGHLSYLNFARAQGDCLVVGVNSDASVRRYKDPRRPILPQDERAALLAGLKPVDYVVIFDEDEPRDLIASLRPDVLVKGEDWAHYVSGREEVEAAGGRVVLAPLVPGRSTSAIIRKILELHPPS